MAKDRQLKYWLNQLCKKMNDTISASDDINQCIQRIKDQGFDLCLFLEATVCVSQEEEETPFHRYKKLISSNEPKKGKRLRLTKSDKTFLESLKISLGNQKRTPPNRHRLNPKP
ncbi:hypothetical protein ACFLU6_08205 [Acidobacteriota bacterium]